MYLTAWTLHLWLLPRTIPQFGHGKDVLSLSTRGVPEDAHTIDLLPDTLDPRLAAVIGALFSVDCGYWLYIIPTWDLSESEILKSPHAGRDLWQKRSCPFPGDRWNWTNT